MERNWATFISGFSSEATQDNYRKWGREVMKDPDAFAALAIKDPTEAENQVLAWVVETKKRVPSSVSVRLAPAKGFLRYMKAKDFDWEDIKRATPKAAKVARDRPPTKDELRAMRKVAGPRERFIISAVSSSGPRRGMFYFPRVRGGYGYMRVGDLEFRKKSGLVKAKVYAGEPEEYTTYFSPEAAEDLTEYLSERRRVGEIITPDSPVLRDAWDWKKGRATKSHPEAATPLTEEAVYDAIYFVKRRAGILKTSKDGGFKALHGLRKYFDTNFPVSVCDKGHGKWDTEVLMGHLKSYHKPTDEHLEEICLKAAPSLMIDEKWEKDDALKTVRTEHDAKWKDMESEVLKLKDANRELSDGLRYAISKLKEIEAKRAEQVHV